MTISIAPEISYLTCILVTQDGSAEKIGVIFYSSSDTITDLKQSIRNKFKLPDLNVLKKGMPLTALQGSIYKVSQAQDERKISLPLTSNGSPEDGSSILGDKENPIDLTDIQNP